MLFYVTLRFVIHNIYIYNSIYIIYIYIYTIVFSDGFRKRKDVLPAKMTEPRHVSSVKPAHVVRRVLRGLQSLGGLGAEGPFLGGAFSRRWGPVEVRKEEIPRFPKSTTNHPKSWMTTFWGSTETTIKPIDVCSDSTLPVLETCLQVQVLVA